MHAIKTGKTAILLTGLLLATTATAVEFTLTSPELKPDAMIANEQVFKGFGCQGSNISPELTWQGAPKGTKSFGLTVYDPDAPTGSGWWHWVIFNIPADTTGLKKGAGDAKGKQTPAEVVQSRTDFGQVGYGGPCPPVGDKPHRYQFTIFALKTEKLPLDENTPAAMVGFYLRQNRLGTATLQGLFGR
ncbi:DLP12 prophage; periplasmic protein YbcL [Gammaproteobacteria bacterium]